MQIDHQRAFRLFKYTVYALLTLNVYLFFAEEWAASAYRFADGVALKDVIEGFAASIDTAAWVVLLLMFELETDLLADHHFTRAVTYTLHVTRAVCYAFIVYAFYGYVTKLSFLLGAAPAEVSNLCALPVGDWVYAIDLDEYSRIDAGNCQSFSTAGSFLQFAGMTALVDAAGYTDILRLAWVDVINSGVWLLVVLVLEIDVRLQERNRLNGTALHLSNGSKYILYSLLLLAAVYWGFKGDFVDFWDAFLWLLAFVAIEMNVFEWRQETLQQERATASP
ncbi:MAG: hypothetical protein KJO31_06705 [Gammaproteobacteria bacterium]|nr:hypothetical protein [Gammaproteobacteria bacterium]